jgi:hypothetical protein
MGRRAMSDHSGVFDQLADALQAAGARSNQGQTKIFASRPIPVPIVARPEIISAPPPRRKREVDRSRDHAAYAAPHRPLQPHAHARPDDVITVRLLRRAIATASKAHRVVPVTLVTFAITVALGLGLFLVVR